MREGLPQGDTLLALYKGATGLLLLAVAIELEHLIGEDLTALLEVWVHRIHVDPHNPLIAALLDKAGTFDSGTLEEYALIAGVFGNVHLVEGVGFWRRRPWAEYVCIASTVLFLPLEVYEVVQTPHLAQVATLLVNLAICVYLIRRMPILTGASRP